MIITLPDGRRLRTESVVGTAKVGPNGRVYWVGDFFEVSLKDLEAVNAALDRENDPSGWDEEKPDHDPTLLRTELERSKRVRITDWYEREPAVGSEAFYAREGGM